MNSCVVPDALNKAFAFERYRLRVAYPLPHCAVDSATGTVIEFSEQTAFVPVERS